MFGERLVEMFSSRQGPVRIASPFIKRRALQRVLNVLPDGTSVSVYTRWLPFEVAVGVSDVEVYDVVSALEKGRVCLLRELHGKAYYRGEKGLVGSGNLTLAGMGWRQQSNLEVFVESDIDDGSVSKFFDELERRAYEAGPDIRDAIEKCASQIDVDSRLSGYVTRLVNGYSSEELEHGDPADLSGSDGGRVWLPRTSEPRRLYDVYSDSGLSVLASTREDAHRDLDALGVPSGLGRAEFVAHIRANLVQAAVANIAHRSVIEGEEPKDTFIREFGFTEEVAREQWEIVADWLMHFFPDKYRLEAPAESYRLVPSRMVE